MIRPFFLSSFLSEFFKIPLTHNGRRISIKRSIQLRSRKIHDKTCMEKTSLVNALLKIHSNDYFFQETSGRTYNFITTQ